ncbi:MAG TPA: sulfatase [Candidatus Polarisedimenticolia bacterium]|nr:sulfatase [Candidatus Polarisedimenticolia bacterium]
MISHHANPAARSIAATLLLLVTAAMAGCSASPPPPVALHLVEEFDPSSVKPASAPVRSLPRTQWRGDALGSWRAGPGVRKLKVRDARLAGETTTGLPILHVERTEGPRDRDLLHAVEVRMRASSAGTLAVDTSAEEKVDLARIAQDAIDFPWVDTTPIVAGDPVRSYTLRLRRPPDASRVRHVFIQPADAPGVHFEIESVRLIFRREHLAGVPSGVGWHGLSEVYRETIVSRAPESFRIDASLSSESWLDLAVGTIDDAPVTFVVEAAPAGGASKAGDPERVLLERTVTTPHRWEEVAVDLGSLPWDRATLSFSLKSGAGGAPGFWGAPVIRRRHVGPQAARDGRAAPRGVILIWADTLRRDHLDVYGYRRETSPALRRMAEEGALFTGNLVNATWTKVSTPSLLTSLYPTSHGVKEFADRLPAAATTLAEVYREAGYATLSMSSILFTGRFTNLHQGFEVVHEDTSLPDRKSSKTAREYVDRLLPWIESRRDAPFFVFLHVSDPHDPFKPAPPYDTLWADPAAEAQHERDAKKARDFIEEPLLKAFGMPNRGELERAGIDPDAYVAHDRDWYDGSIRGMDTEIGRLLERLRTLGLDEECLVVFTSDHGEEFLDHGRTFHGQSVYGELSNAALIVWGPGRVPAGRVIDDLTESIDVMPTLLALSGLRPPDAMQGRSLAPLLAAPAGAGLMADASADSATAVFVEKAALSEGSSSPPPHATEALAILHGRWKLIHNTRRLPGSAVAEFELFDHRSDPLDQVNLAGEHPDRVRELAERLNRWRSMALGARLSSDSEAEESLSPEELERLRSLGYIQ